jgi:hypothetical protein
LSAGFGYPPTTIDPNEIGTTLLYEPSPVFNPTEFRDNAHLSSFLKIRKSRECTRTLEAVGSVGGGGVCQFVIEVEVALLPCGASSGLRSWPTNTNS